MNFRPHLQVTLIVQARMGASRLLGKPLLKVLGKPLLSILLERLKTCISCKTIIVATTDKEQDRPIARLAEETGVVAYCGSEENVLERYFLAASSIPSDVIVRITADCPLVDPFLIDEMVYRFLERSHLLDYLSNTLERSYPRGEDIEVFSMEALERAHKEAKDPSEREHVTLYMYRHPERFRLENVKNGVDLSSHRWTVDTQEDFELIRRIINALYPQNKLFNMQDVVKLLKEHPDWSLLNKHVRQKDPNL